MTVKELKKISKAIGFKENSVVESIVKILNGLPKGKRFKFALKLILGKL